MAKNGHQKLWVNTQPCQLKGAKRHQNYIWIVYGRQRSKKSNRCVASRGETSGFPSHQIEQNQGTEKMTWHKYFLEKDICTCKHSNENILLRKIICQVKIFAPWNICLSRIFCYGGELLLLRQGVKFIVGHRCEYILRQTNIFKYISKLKCLPKISQQKCSGIDRRIMIVERW